MTLGTAIRASVCLYSPSKMSLASAANFCLNQPIVPKICMPKDMDYKTVTKPTKMFIRCTSNTCLGKVTP